MTFLFYLVKTKIKFTNKTDIAVNLQILCETKYVIQNDIILTVELKELYGGVVNSTLVQCETYVQFQSLSYATSYELNTYWTSPQGSKCYINSTNNVFTLSDVEIATIILVPIYTITILSTVFTFCLVYYKWFSFKVRELIIILMNVCEV